MRFYKVSSIEPTTDFTEPTVRVYLEKTDGVSGPVGELELNATPEVISIVEEDGGFTFLPENMQHAQRFCVGQVWELRLVSPQ